MDHVAKVPEWKALKGALWPAQYRAVRFVANYLTNAHAHERAALVRMPTGTGKTGVMAVVANLVQGVGDVLIVVPSKQLTEQIPRHLMHDFWVRIAHEPKSGPKRTVSVVPSGLQSALDSHTPPRIFVCTQKALADLQAAADGAEQVEACNSKGWVQALKALHQAVDLVLVDEGHREPARTWAKAVRAFGKPTVLFSATPYRNDLRLFRVGQGPAYRYEYRYHDAVSHGIIRDVHLQASSEPFAGSPSKFAKALLEFLDSGFPGLRPTAVGTPKVLIRCESRDSIKRVKASLEKHLSQHVPKCLASTRVAAVHERLRPDPQKGLYNEVPAVLDASFWIHQFLLTEGIDDSDFCVVALFEDFGNARSLVQQAGRILRNPSLPGCPNTPPLVGQKAVVFHDRDSRTPIDWSGYLAFEQSPHALVGAEELIQWLRESQPEWHYASGEYRRAFDFGDVGRLTECLRLRRSAQVYRLRAGTPSAALAMLARSLSDHLGDYDMVEQAILGPDVLPGDTWCLVHCRVRPSEHLAGGTFFDISLVPSVLCRDGDLLFVNAPIELPESDREGVAEGLPVEQMERLLGGDKTEANIKHVSLANCDIGNTSIRRRTLGAFSLVASAPGLADHFHYASTATGTVVQYGEQRRRYVGLSRGRVTEARPPHVPLQDFVSWTEQVARALRDRGLTGTRLLDRYAEEVRPPANSRAAHMLLDLNELLEVFMVEDGPYEQEAYESVACDVLDPPQAGAGQKWNFSCKVAGQQIRGLVYYDKGRFAVKSPELDDLLRIRNPNASSFRRASSFVSKGSNLRIITEDRLVYGEGRFYRPRRLFGADRASDLGELVGMKALREMDAAKGEKGRTVGPGDKWESGCLFDLIDTDDTFFEHRGLRRWHLVCDDMGTETADFIAVDDEKLTVAYVHATMGAGPDSFSAAPFQTVQAQATKNLESLDPFSAAFPNKAAGWRKRWTDNKAKGTVGRARFLRR